MTRFQNTKQRTHFDFTEPKPGKAKMCTDGWGQGRRAEKANISHRARMTGVPSDLLCRGHQWLLPLEKSLVFTLWV